MEIQRSKYQTFAYTLTLPEGKPGSISESDFDDWFNFITHERPICKIEGRYFETGKQGRLHCHGVLVIPKNYLRTKLHKKGYFLKLVEIYDRVGWESYIRKEQEYEISKFLPERDPDDDLCLTHNIMRKSDPDLS